MANSDVFINDVRLQDLGIIVRLNSQEPMLPSLRTNTIAIPGRHGAYDFGAFFDAREFLLDCVFKRQDYADLKVQIRQFVRLFVDDYGRPKSVKLRFGDEPDKYYNVKVSAGVPIERLAGMGSFTLTLVAHDPMAKFIVPSDEIIMDTDIPVLSDITLDATYKYAVTGNTKFSIINDGTAVVRPDIVIEGKADNIVVWNTLNGKTFFVNAINSTIEISGEDYTVKQGGVSTLSKFEGDFLELMPGSNPLVITADNANLTMTFKFSHKYL